MKLKYKSLKKIIKKKKLWIFSVLFIGFFFMTIIETQNTKADATTEYTEFLENDALVEYSSVGIYGDYFNLLQEKAIQDNSFRNYFATGNVPYNVKTQNSWIYYKTSATNYKYGVVQSYFDLTNKDTFRNNDIINTTYTFQDNIPNQNNNFTVIDGNILTNNDLLLRDNNFKRFNASTSNFQYNITYRFDNEAIGSNPNNWTIGETGGSVNIHYGIDSLYNIIEMNDTSGAGDTRLQNLFSKHNSNIEFGTVEYYFRTNDNTKSTTQNLRGIAGRAIYLYISGGNFWYSDGVSHVIAPCPINTWITISIDFECQSNLYKGLNPDTWKIEINGVSYGPYNFWNGQDYLDNIYIETSHSSLNYKSYFVNFGYSFDGNYTIGNYKLYDISKVSRIETIINIDCSDKLENKDYWNNGKLYYSNRINNTLDNFILQIYNFNTLLYNDVNTTINHGFSENIFNINQNHFNNTDFYFKFKYVLENYTSFDYLLDIDQFTINITYNDVIHYYDNEISYNVKFSCYTASGSGYQREFTISYTINSTGVSWKWSWKVSGMPSSAESTNFVIDNKTIDVKSLEIQTHFYYGKSTIDTNDINDYTCIQTNIFLNYNLSLVYNSIYEFNDDNTLYGGVFAPAAYFDTSFIAFFNDYENSDYDNNDYFYNSLVGIRVFRGLNSETYNRFFIIPFFSDGVDLRQYIYVGTTPFDVLNEPMAPSGSTDYWEFTTFRLTFSFTKDINVGNISTNFTMLEVQQYKAKYYYQKRVITNRDLGNWRIKISSSIKISFNFIRNTIVAIMNILLLFFQYILYLLTYGISFVFMFIVCYIALFFWNYVIYYLYIAIIWIFWFFWLFLMWIWNMLLWIWKYIVIPLGNWIWNVLIPILMDFAIKSIAFFLTILIYVLTLGQIDFNETYLFIYDTLWLIVRELYEWFKVFMENILYVLMFIFLYLICLMYLYFRYLMARARGFDKKAQKYYYTLTFFFTPFMLIFNWVKQLLDITPVA